MARLPVSACVCARERERERERARARNGGRERERATARVPEAHGVHHTVVALDLSAALVERAHALRVKLGIRRILA